jgi:iron(III) transport system substrate-binding protein
MRLTEVRRVFVLTGCLVLLAQLAYGADANDVALYRGADRQARLENGAKAEGEVGWYTSVSAPDSQKIIEVFEQRYPYIKVKLVRTNSASMVQRFTTELQAKRYVADILDTNDTRIEFLRRKGTLQPYRTPVAEKFDKRFLQPQGFWVANRATMLVLGYNTRLVKSAEAPQRYEDLLDQKWKDKIALEREDSQWLMGLMEYWGEEKGKAFFQRLRAQNPKIRTGHTLLAQLIAAGEDFLSPNTHSQGIATGQRNGAPVEWINLEPVIGASNVSGLSKNAPHPHAAMLFLDFMLSKDGGQKILREVNRIPTHPEVPPNPARLREGFNFVIVDPVKYNDRIDHYSKLWHEWFLH